MGGIHTEPNANCPICGKAVFFFKSTNVYLDRYDGKLRPHPCTKRAYKYNYLNKKNIPKIRNRKTELEKKGWIFLTVTETQATSLGTYIFGKASDNPTLLRFGAAEILKVKKSKPTYFRYTTPAREKAEIDFFEAGSPIPCRKVFFCNCDTDLDLASRLTAISTP